MKPHFHKVPKPASTSFALRHDFKSNFGTLWHFHPELEIHYIVKGQGIQYIGDTVSSFSDGDLIFLGENLPHTWRCGEEYFRGDESKTVEAYVLHFLPECFGHDFLKIPEAQAISSLFEKAKKGLKINGEAKIKIAGLLNEIMVANPLQKMILLLSILQELVQTQDFETISPGYGYSHLTNGEEMKRLDQIYTYVMSHYREEISLEMVSSLANLSVSSFCRYFRKMTNKTFFEFLVEVRISHACKKIIANQLALEVICYECGFHNVSNFYRHFKKVTGLTPNAYKKEYHSKLHTVNRLQNL